MRSLLLISLFLAGCGLVDGAVPAIIGGEEPSAGLMSHLVGLRAADQGTRSNYCSGSYLGHGLVLTAAHCVNSLPPLRFVAIGRDIFGEDVLLRPILSQTAHGSFASFNYANDIAIVTFDDSGLALRPVNLVGSRYERVAPGTSLLAMGFGKSAGAPANGILRMLGLTIVKGDVLGHWFQAQGPRGTGMCFGDSGGPGFIEAEGEMFQAGIVSNGTNECIDEQTQYTNVLDYRGWIEEHAGASVAFARWDELAASRFPAEVPLTGPNGIPLDFRSWCESFGALDDGARRTVSELLKVAGSLACVEAAATLAERTELDLSFRYLSDARPLASLSGLRKLSLRGNSLRDVSSLAALTGVQSLDLRDNRYLPKECPLPGGCLFD